MYQKSSSTDTDPVSPPSLLIKWYSRSRDDTNKLTFEHNKEEDVSVTQIVNKAIIFDSESDVNQFRDIRSSDSVESMQNTEYSFYCNQYWILEEDSHDTRTLLPVSDSAFNARHWADQQQEHGQIFSMHSERRSSNSTNITTSSHEEKRDLTQRPISMGSPSVLNQIPIHPVPPSQRMLATNHNVNTPETQSQSNHSRPSNRSTVSSSDTSSQSVDCNQRNNQSMVRNANRMRRTRKRARSQPVTNSMRNVVDIVNPVVNPEGNGMEPGNQAVDLDPLNAVNTETVQIQCDHHSQQSRHSRHSENELGILSDGNRFQREPPRKRRRIVRASSCSNCKKILKLKVQLLDSSLQQKENIIGHYNTLIHQKDSVVDQKDGVIRQKDDLIDTYKSIVTMGSRQ